MKIQLFILVYVLTLSSFVSQGQEKVNIEKILSKQLEYGASAENGAKDTMIKEVLKSQLKDGNSIPLGDEYESHDYSEKDLEVTISIIENILVSQGYKIPTQSEFKEKIKLKLNRIIDDNSGKKYLYIDLFDKCSRDIVYSRSTIYNGFFIIKNNNFITSLYAIPELIDYQKEYPDLKKIEENQIIKQEPDLGLDIEIPRWKDIKDLSQQRRFNQQLLIARNKYLFNDDQSQFSWLINNDSEFMRSLVTYFGYTEDKKLLKWVIDNTDLDFYTLRANGLLNFNEFGSLFWNKNCDGKLKLHPNTFKMLQELYKPNDNSTMRFLLEYIAGYLEYLLDKDNYKGILTEEDKVKIGANLVYFAEQYKYNPEFKDSNRMMGRFRYFTSEDYDGVIKNNSYYNLPKFREWWDKAEYDEDFVRECEYDGTCGRDNPEPDPNNPKYKNSF